MHTTDPNNVLLAGDLITWATIKTNQIGTLVQLVASVMVVIAIIMAYWKSKSWVATGVALLLGALVLWGIHNMSDLQDKVGSEIKSGPASTRTVAVIPHPASQSRGDDGRSR